MIQVIQAISDPTRQKILTLLRHKRMTAGEIAGHFPYSKPTLSRHLSVLKKVNLVDAERKGNHIIYKLNLSVLEDTILCMAKTFNLSCFNDKELLK